MKKTEKLQKTSEDLQRSSENLQKTSEDLQRSSEDNQDPPPGSAPDQSEKVIRPKFALPKIRIPRIYVERPFMRRVVFLGLLLFVYPVLVSLILLGSFALACYWFIKTIVG